MKLFNIKANRAIVSNLTSLTVLQFAGYVFPLITIPYLTRVLGPSNFGLVNYALAFCGYFFLLVNYSFDLTAVRSISSEREDLKAVSNIFFTVFFAKVLLFFVSSVTFTVALLAFPFLRANAGVYTLMFLYVIGEIFFPRWFYQGIEKLSSLAILNFVAKLISTIAIFVFVRNEHDVLFYPALLSGAQIIIGLSAFAYAVKKYSLQMKVPSRARIIKELKDNFSIFLSGVAITLYTTSNVFLLGTMTAIKYVGYYSSALKVVTVVQALVLAPVYQTFFPFFSKQFADSVKEGRRKLHKIMRVQLAFTLVVSLLILAFAREAVLLVGGRQYLPAVATMIILSFMPVVMGLSNVFAFQGLLNIKEDRIFLALVLASLFVNILMNLILIPWAQDKGTAISSLVSESVLAGASCYLFEKKARQRIQLELS